MFVELMKKVFGSHNERFLKKLKPIVDQINSLEKDIEKLSDDELAAQTIKFKERLAQGEALDSLLPEAFATTREAAKRTLGQRHFDVQLMGGIVLHRGMIAEMATGEGKTLVATLPCYLNALTGKGVTVVTVNDYLAKRDAEWMGAIHRKLGLTVGCILNEMSDSERQEAYACDITYATNNELGFDYLRDNMKFRMDEVVQRGFNYAIVDEVDSILIDEARTPLIISGPAEDSSELYIAANKVIPSLSAEHFEKDEKSKSVTFTELGSQRIEESFEQMGLLRGGSLYDIQNISLVHHANQALRAHKTFARDVDYIVKDDKIIIIDEFTGRMMDGRRYSDGLHQALEAKEGVVIQNENQTLASITFQNYFRLYNKLAGMTGTAKTEAAEFADIYNLDVIQITTNVPVVRKDQDDEVYRTEEEKIGAITKLIKERHTAKQPILVGTVSIEKSEQLSQHLKKQSIPHQVLNARYHEQEAGIVAQAGRPGAVTIATNMAGRGTDIKLGGNVDVRIADEQAKAGDTKDFKKLEDKIRAEMKEASNEVREAGGLYVIGTERHESRRIDNQLRGRSGRQGDPGASKFFLSLQDDLMRIFGSDRLNNMLQRLGLQEGEAITHPWVNKALERAQQKVEARNYDIRKHLLKYDNVMNDQRKVVYEQRRELMQQDDASEMIQEMREDVLDTMIDRFIPKNAYPDQWEVDALHEECLRLFGLDLPIKEWSQEEGIAEQEIHERITKAVTDHMQSKEGKYGAPLMRVAEKSILLRVLDQNWKDHLLILDHLRQGIGLRGYAQRDPLNEYKQEAFSLFHEMLHRIRESTTAMLSHLEMNDTSEEQIEEAAFEEEETPTSITYSGPGLDVSPIGSPKIQKATESIAKRLAQKKPKQITGKGKKKQDMIADEEINRNAPCPCGSGKRYKHCHGKIEANE
jgi:preprotein translocase subunit SecA